MRPVIIVSRLDVFQPREEHDHRDAFIDLGELLQIVSGESRPGKGIGFLQLVWGKRRQVRPLLGILKSHNFQSIPPSTVGASILRSGAAKTQPDSAQRLAVCVDRIEQKLARIADLLVFDAQFDL